MLTKSVCMAFHSNSGYVFYILRHSPLSDNPLKLVPWSPRQGFFFFFLVFLASFLRAAPVTYGASQARGLIRAVAADLHQSYSNARYKLHL